MADLLYDKDVQMFLLTVFSVLGLHALNQWKLRYKENWRYWIGIILVAMGLAGIIINPLKEVKQIDNNKKFVVDSVKFD